MPIENIIYSDIDLRLKMIPGKVDRDINILSNAASIRRSLRHLLMIKKYDVPFDNTIQSSLDSLLFEPINKITSGNLATRIEFVIIQNEPRVHIKLVQVTLNDQENGYDVNVFYTIKSLNLDDQLTLLLKRVR